MIFYFGISKITPISFLKQQMDFGSPLPSGNLDENRLDYGAENVANISLNWDQAPQPVSGI